MNNYNNYSHSDRIMISNIVSVKEWNATATPDNKINVNYGYVMPVYGGYDWKATKKALIEKYRTDYTTQEKKEISEGMATVYANIND